MIVPYATAGDGLTLDDVLAASEFAAGWFRTDAFLHSRPFTLTWAGPHRWLSWWPLRDVTAWDEDPGETETSTGSRVIKTPDLPGAPGAKLAGTGEGGWGHFDDAPASIPIGTVLRYPDGSHGYQADGAIVMVQGRRAGTPMAWMPPRLLQSTVRTIARRLQAQQNQPGTMAYEGPMGPLTMGLTRQLHLYRVPDDLL